MSRYRHPSLLAGGSGRGAGFTLVELMVSIAILIIMSLLLVSISNMAAKVYVLELGQNQYRLQARAVLNYMGRDLRRASLAANQASAINNVPAISTLEFLINPNGYNNPDSIFWQAPIATDGGAQGDMAEVGYFVRWTAGEGDLCRFFVNPSDTTDYSIYTKTSGTWISQTILDSVAPSDSGNHYKGLFLQNVVGLWVQAYNADGTPLLASPHSAYNSSAHPYSVTTTSTNHSLPAYVIISIAVLDGPSARILQQANSGSNVAPGVISSYSTAVNAESFVTAVEASAAPVYLKRGISAATLKVSLDNYK